jgi:protein SCO1/2
LILSLVQAHAGRWGKEYVPNVPVVTQDGQVLRFYDDLIQDRIVVLSFIYASCQDICPLATARLAEAQERLGDRVGRDIFFYSISIEPERDTPARLKQYADAFRAGPGWLFLTGLPEDIQAIRHKFGDRRPDLVDHRNDVVLGNGRTGEWQRESPLGDIEHFVEVVRAMDATPLRTPENSSQSVALPPTPAATTYDVGFVMDGRQPGSAMFAKLCSGCHTIGRGDRVGPDLDGLSLRRSRAWITEFLKDPVKMRARQDPIALALAAKFPGVRMPYLQIHDSDAADLIAYIDAHATLELPTIALDPLMALTTHEGAHLTSTDLLGQPFAVLFGYTHCPDICPTSLLQWSNLLQRAGSRADTFKVLFVSVDGERDTPEALKVYLTAFDPRIVALTGPASAIATAAAQFGAPIAKVPGRDGGYTMDHSIKSYLVDQHQHLTGTLDLANEEAEQLNALAVLLGRP